jgi:hypothetical protein
MPILVAAVLGLLAAVTTGGAVQPDSITTSAGAVVITPIQHAGFTLQAGAKTIYVDPSPQAPSAKPKADLIIITDIHQGHMDPAGSGGIIETRHQNHCSCCGSENRAER